MYTPVHTWHRKLPKDSGPDVFVVAGEDAQCYFTTAITKKHRNNTGCIVLAISRLRIFSDILSTLFSKQSSLLLAI